MIRKMNKYLNNQKFSNNGRSRKHLERDREKGEREERERRQRQRQREYNNHINCREVDLSIHTFDNYLTKEIRKRRACFYQNHFHSTKPLILLYTPLILRIATDIILLRSPNFTDYLDYTSSLCLIDPYYNYARHNTNINILNDYEQWKYDQRSRILHFLKLSILKNLR